MTPTIQHLQTDASTTGDAPTGQCYHADRRLVYRHGGSGLLYCYQCQRCGHQVQGNLSRGSQWVMRRSIPQDELRVLTEFDQSLEDQWYAEQQQKQHQLLADNEAAHLRRREEERQMWQEAHTAYLLTPEWRKLRMLVLERENNTCQGCRSARAAEVHHATYEHWRNEFLFELVALCRACHARYHDQLPNQPTHLENMP